jgi:hypothetical protein
MSQYGTGFRNTILKGYQQKEKRFFRYVVDDKLIKVGSEYI